jgi:glycosyltransferase involved in cell wall biosynthesis
MDRFRNAAAGDLRARLGLDGREVLLYVGRIAREKGLDLLLRAFAQVHARRPQTRLLLIGSGPYKDGAEHLRDKLGLNATVIFVGAVPYAEIAPYYAAADLFVFSSTTETQGLVLLESLAAGTPVVAVSAPGAADVLKDGGGHLTEATDDDFAQGIVRVLEDEAQLSRLRQEAPAVAERYSIDAATRLMIEVYEHVVRSRA